MEVTSTKASLVADGDVEAESRLSVTLPRLEVEAALAEDEAPELVLDVLRAKGEGRDGERHTISVGWDPADIKKLLLETPGETITFAFERDELERLVSDDTELHGVRDKALVLSVAVGVAAAGATSAMAKPADPTGPPTGRAAPAASVSTHDELTATQRGIESPVAFARDELTSAQRGIETPPASSKDELTASQRGIDPVVASQRDELTAAQRGIDPAVVSQRDELTAAQRGIPDEFVATPDEATLAQRGIQTPAVSAPETAAASDAPTIDPSTAAALGIAGGMGLLIVGAAFVARRQRSLHPA